MIIRVVTRGLRPYDIEPQPWIRFRAELAQAGFTIDLHDAFSPEAFAGGCDAMILFVWQHWQNRERFIKDDYFIPLENLVRFRSAHPEVVQITINHTDMSRAPYCLPYWRPDDWILFRTPSYSREELWPLSQQRFWAYEIVWGSSRFRGKDEPRYLAGFIGQPSGPSGYREKVAAYTSKVGIGKCQWGHRYSEENHAGIMGDCAIVVCPRGWGGQSLRHWDSWLYSRHISSSFNKVPTTHE